jgi:hypothetical protein
MHPIKSMQLLLIVVPVLVVASCIKPYDPGIQSGDEKKLVISGLVSTLDGNQVVSVSLTSPINKPGKNPVPGCTVTIKDNAGRLFPMIDSSNGNYYTRIDPQYLVPGSSFQLQVITPDGNTIVSDFDSLTSGPAVDSVYYIRKDIPTTNPSQPIKGIQFYVNLNASSTDSHYYRWECSETWEHHADYPIEFYYSGMIHHVSPPDYSKNVCWSTLTVRNVFTLKTTGLSSNRYRLLPLHFVDNKTSRLVYGYSLLVNQFSLSHAAYEYWNQLRINSTNEGGLYERQPLAANGNMHNLTHPDQEVLGFFGACSVSSKRIFVSNVPGLEMEYYSKCSTSPLNPYQLTSFNALEYPIYLMLDSLGFPSILMSKDCVDCRASSGTTTKPAFWPI